MANEPEASAPDGSGVARGGRRWLIIGGVGVIVVALVAAALWWYLRDDSPAKVSLDAATKSVTTVAGQRTVSLPGTWKVDTTTGSFDFSSASGTFAGFRVHEDLSGVGSTTAVGRTGGVDGSMTIEGDHVTAASFTVDLTTITTDREMRNQRVQSALDTTTYPKATFALTEPIALPAGAADAKEISVQAKGDLTIHGVTKPVTIRLQARLTGATIVVVGSIDLTFSDFGVQVPAAPIVLSVDDHGTMELQLLLTKS